MAIKVANYNFKGVSIKDAIIRVERLFGSSKEGWNSLVTVTFENKENPENIVFEQIEDFNFQAPFNKDERGYVTIYKALMDKFEGTEV